MTETIRFRIQAPADRRDELVASVHSLGCLGVHEDGAVLVAYFAAGTPRAPVLALADSQSGVVVRGPERVPSRDWERAWREGLAPRRVGELWIRPSWCASQGSPELVIDPRQAFGSGEHASTRLALRLALEALRPGDRLLDLGTGSGILALGALRMGARWACGLDVDRAACVNAAQNSAHNALPLALVCGTPAALDPEAGFELVVANLLLSRLEPWLPALAAHAPRALVVSGYLESEAGRIAVLARDSGWSIAEELREAQSGDTWCASRLAQTRSLQSPSRSASVSSRS